MYIRHENFPLLNGIPFCCCCCFFFVFFFRSKSVVFELRVQCEFEIKFGGEN